MTADPLLSFVTSVRASNHIARRLGAFYQGQHYTGINTNESNLSEILDRRDAINEWLLRQLETCKGVLVACAVCLVDDLGRLTGNSSGIEVAHCDYGARRRLADAVMLLGRLESFRWFMDKDFKIRDIRRIMQMDGDWRVNMLKYVPSKTASPEECERKATMLKAVQDRTGGGPSYKKLRPRIRLRNT